ncbi:MAG: hypothetical protein EWV85_11150 [Microcystis aeruginosa Ma_QC_C_20070703_M131]|uniref:Uncharacterized protein n=1 Tax=Microcystis aeruginosa Ma_QC_C_20070703_M131 TaxID=2486263 RepID=A0A551Y0N2_MICAE|nr:MAG: hypothetical protein EWV85_11150 [Microcystis aeruginosa Ma_QC_C_20070703_M131]
MKIYYYLFPSRFPRKTPDRECLDLTNFTTNYTIDQENLLDSDLGVAREVFLIKANNRFWGVSDFTSEFFRTLVLV